MERKRLIAGVTGVSLAVAGAANATLVFRDNFEPTATSASNAQSLLGAGTTPDVATYTVANTSGQANTTLWVRSAVGFNSSRNGLVDESENGGANFTDPTGTQAYAFRYTNSGVTSAAGTVGTLAANQTITVTFDLLVDGFNGGNAYDVSLVTFNGGARNDMDAVGYFQGTTSVLDRVAGTISHSGYQTFSFAYTVGDNVVHSGADGTGTTTFSNAVIGHDIGIRFDGATNSATWDNVSVDIVVPEPASLGLLGLGALALGRRRR